MFKPEQIINKLREAEILLSQGATVGEARQGIKSARAMKELISTPVGMAGLI